MNLIEVRKLRKAYGDVQALAGVDLNLKRAEIFGIVGPDGAGKTTLIRILGQLLKADSGEITYPGQSQDRLQVGYIPQRFSLYRDLSVQENIDFFADVYGLKNYAQRRDQLLDQIGLLPFRKRLADQLSGGMKQKLALCCSLIHEPQLLLMDEPTTGVDPVSRREFWNIVFRLQREGLTVLSSTPYMDEAEQFDRVVLLHQGEVLRQGTADEVRHSIPGEMLEVFVQQPHRAREVLRKSGVAQEVELFGDSLHVAFESGAAAHIPEIERTLISAGLEVREIRPCPFSIEDVFLKVAR